MAPSSDLLARLRKADPDRFFCTLFAPPETRDTLALLYLFNHELARAREVAREPVLALIRLNWWREVVDGAVRSHETAGPLAAALAQGRLQSDMLRHLVSAREIEAEPGIPDFAAFMAYARGTAGMLARIAGQVLGTNSQVVEDFGTAYGISGILRTTPFLAAQGRSLLPLDGSTHRQLADAARQLLRATAPRETLAAVLPAVFAKRDLGRKFAPRGMGDRLAVLRAAITGRI